MNRLLGLLVLFTFMAGCDRNRVYERFVELDGQWIREQPTQFEMEITDTARTYQIFVTVTNSSTYQFYNLYLDYRLMYEDDSVVMEGLQELILFDPKTGVPRGSGAASLFSNETLLIDRLQAIRPGVYTLELGQFMRLDTLEDIQRVGVRLAYLDED